MTNRPVADLSGLLAHIGKRMTIRLRDGDGYRDIVGTLQSEGTLLNRHNEIVEFSPEEISIFRVIQELPDRAGKGAPQSIRINELEEICRQIWPAIKEVQLGGWRLRLSGKFTMRANSVLPQGSPPYGDPGMEITDAIQKVVDIYNRENIPPIFHIPLPTYSALYEKLIQLGWEEKVHALAMVTDISKSSEIISTEILEDATEEWLAVQGDQGIARIMASYPALYCAVRMDGKLVATGRAAINGSWCVLSRIYTAPDSRGKGYARALITSLLNQAAERGATKSVLQVDSKNIPAIGLYDSLGFTFHHDYAYLGLPRTGAKSVKAL